jgi:PAS domain S-box-containing protein
MRLKLATRLTLLNLTICMGIGLIIAIQFISYDKVETLLRQISHDHMDQVVRNAQNSRDLANILADINLLTRSFFERDNHLKLMSRRILSDLTLLGQINRDPQVADKIRQFTFFVRSFLEQCHTVNMVLVDRRGVEQALDRHLNTIEAAVADLRIDGPPAGEDVAYTEQVSLLVFGYRESLLNIGKRVHELGYDHFADPVADRPIQDLLGDLEKRLRSPTAADARIRESVAALGRGITRYETVINTLYDVMRAFRIARQELRDSQGQLLHVMADVDNRLAQSAGQVDRVIKALLQRTAAIVGGLAVAILAALIVASTIFLIKHVKRPLDAIQEGINKFSAGALDQPIDLKRQDEWGAIEVALNRMAQEMLASYSALEISEDRYRTLVQAAPSPIIVHHDNRIIFANDAAITCLEAKSAADIVGRSTSEFIHPQSLAIARNRIAQLYTPGDDGGEQVPAIEEKFITLAGNTIDVLVAAVAITYEGQHAAQVVFQDISERKQAEKEMQRLRKLLENITEAMPSFLAAVDAEGRVTQWNREAQRLTGTPPQKALGRPLDQVFPQVADQMDRIIDAITRCPMEPQGTIHFSVAGRERICDMTVYSLTDENSAGAVIRIDDVTDRVRMKEMMIQSEKMLSVGGLAAGMAHEINNPLAGILQNIQVIENRLLGELPNNERAAAACGIETGALTRYLDQRHIPEMLSAVSASGKRAARIIDNMLGFARKGESVRAANDLATLMDLTLELAENDFDLKKNLDFRHIRIEKEYDKRLAPIPCSSSKIQQVLLNLLRNGAQAMAAARVAAPQFHLRILRKGEMARIEVQDNGPGMDETTRRRVFEPFYTTKEVGEGTGLGLSVSYFIVTENHQGTMSVTSTPGQGSTFVIELPMNPN